MSKIELKDAVSLGGLVLDTIKSLGADSSRMPSFSAVPPSLRNQAKEAWIKNHQEQTNADILANVNPLLQTQMEYSQKAFDYENAYNTPEKQRLRLEQAGLNPLFYGLDGNLSGTLQPVDVNSAATSAAAREQQKINNEMMKHQISNLAADTALKAAQINQANATSENQLAGAEHQRTSAAKEKFETDNLLPQQVEHFKASIRESDERGIALGLENLESRLALGVNSVRHYNEEGITNIWDFDTSENFTTRVASDIDGLRFDDIKDAIIDDFYNTHKLSRSTINQLEADTGRLMASISEILSQVNLNKAKTDESVANRLLTDVNSELAKWSLELRKSTGATEHDNLIYRKALEVGTGIYKAVKSKYLDIWRNNYNILKNLRDKVVHPTKRF